MSNHEESGSGHIRKTINHRLPLIIALFMIIMLMATAGHYGFFGDELYYLACSKKLDWGYVDHPPMVALLVRISCFLFGETLWGLRLMSALAGGLLVLLTTRIAAEIGGGRFAQNLSAFLIPAALSFPAICSFLSMNPFDWIFCSLILLLWIRIIKTGRPKLWLWLGFIAGMGLQNKYSVLVLCFGIFIGMLVTRQKKWLKTPWPYLAAFIAIVLFLPHIIWQIQHGWPTLEFMRNAQLFKNNPLSIFDFLFQVILGLNPLTLPLWIIGWIFLFFKTEKRLFRPLAVASLTFLIVYVTQQSKFYYVLPIFPVLLAAGAVWLERWTSEAGSTRVSAVLRTGPVIRGIVVVVLLLSSAMLMPLGVPILPVSQFVTYSKSIGLWDLIKMERDENENLPLHFVYRFGWEEVTKETAKIYNALPEKDREACALFGNWYGPAGAIDHFGPAYGLPPAISGRNNYWLWGPGEYTGKIVIAIDVSERNLRNYFQDVTLVKKITHRYAYDHWIFLCRRPKIPLNEFWPQLKNYI